MGNSDTLAKGVASAARRLLREEISYEEFLQFVPEDSNDEAIAELVDLIEHIPKRGGLLGANPSELRAYMAARERRAYEQA
jgi:hypothetical protein